MSGLPMTILLIAGFLLVAFALRAIERH